LLCTGKAHGSGDRPERDEARDAWLAGAGVETMRIPAKEVLHDLEAVLRAIVAEAIARLPLHHPASPGGHAQVTTAPGSCQPFRGKGGLSIPRDKLGEE
jgi:hypothetical protein